MAEQDNTPEQVDPLEEAFAAPAAEGHEEPAEVIETEELAEEAEGAEAEAYQQFFLCFKLKIKLLN